MVKYNSKQELRAFLDGRGLGMRKKFGQNFLINPAVRTALIDALGLRHGDKVWEIGPGLGAMTAGLLERGGRITAFEIDPAFANILREIFAGGAFTDEVLARDVIARDAIARDAIANGQPAFRLVEGDVLKTWPALHAETAPDDNLYLFGNLPYNIAAALLADFIEKGRFFKRMVVTVQNEVALRMAAGPGSKDYSSFSVLCSSAYKVSLLRLIKASSFYPEPRVDSRGVRMDLLSNKNKLPPLFYPLVRSLFSSRRKTIRNTLSNFASSVIIKGGPPAGKPHPPAKEAAEEVLCRSGISGDRRAETLGIDEFAALAASLGEIVSDGR